MKAFTIARRDSASYFKSWTGVLIFFFYSVLGGLFFVLPTLAYVKISVHATSEAMAGVPGLGAGRYIFNSFFTNLVNMLMFVFPFLGMRAFAEERSQKTIELLWTYPVSDFDLVAGKFLGMMKFFWVLTLPVFTYLALIYSQGAVIEWGPWAAGYGGYLLLAAAYGALAIFISVISAGPAISAMLTFAVLVGFWILDWAAGVADGVAGRILSSFSPNRHFQSFALGIVDLSDTVFFVFFILYFLFLSLRAVESRHDGGKKILRRAGALFSQVYLAAVLFGIFCVTLALVTRWNTRWDLTPGRIYSLAEGTRSALQKMEGPLQVTAFYPAEDPARNNFEVFLRQCQMEQPALRYDFYDPDRAPMLTKQFKIKEMYTVLVEYQGRKEKILQPTEQSFTNALARLLLPKSPVLCFTAGHGEANLTDGGRNGYTRLIDSLKDSHYQVEEVILAQDGIPKTCQVVIAAGPHRDFDAGEYQLIEKAYHAGTGILFLVDPMDPGAGREFAGFFQKFGILLGMNVVVDKASRLVGGDFLVALVSQYMIHHPITKEFSQPTFFPVSRSVQPSMDLPENTEVTPLALSSGESWAETDLKKLEQGEANFDSSYDVLGPISIAAAAESAPVSGPSEKSQEPVKRMVVIGDSDFLTNAYLDLSGNENFVMSVVRWLSKDDRLITLRPRDDFFEPLLLDHQTKILLLGISLAGIPGVILIYGALSLWQRRRRR